MDLQAQGGLTRGCWSASLCPRVCHSTTCLRSPQYSLEACLHRRGADTGLFKPILQFKYNNWRSSQSEHSLAGELPTTETSSVDQIISRMGKNTFPSGSSHPHCRVFSSCCTQGLEELSTLPPPFWGLVKSDQQWNWRHTSENQKPITLPSPMARKHF